MKLIPYGHQYIDEDDISSVVKALKSDWLTQGPMVEKFERAVADYCGAKYAVAVSNGTAALHITCLAAGIGKGDEVITSPITFVASANCVLYCGGKPVFADVQKDIPNIDPNEIKKKITKKTKALIPVHYSGHPCNMREIQQIAKKYKLIVIEDAAHALGAEYRGSKIGACKYSDMTTLSFHPVKHITTGEGGMVLTNKKDLYEKLLLFRNHGITKDSRKMRKSDDPWYYEQQVLGYNYRITDFQCALGLSQLKKLDKFVAKRRKIVEFYAKELQSSEYYKVLTEQQSVYSSWHLYPVMLKKKYLQKRKNVFVHLKGRGVLVQVHYIPVYTQPYYRKLKYKQDVCPNAGKYYNSAISLPIFPDLRYKDAGYVVKTLKEAIE